MRPARPQREQLACQFWEGCPVTTGVYDGDDFYFTRPHPDYVTPAQRRPYADRLRERMS